MENALRCNSLKCRTSLTDRAVVTTCSHIFCLACSESLGLSSASDGQRSCPACGIALMNPDDAVVAQLNPTEDYKTSILSGLSPTVIMECSARGLASWNYQSTQEIHYQEYLIKSLTEKYNVLSGQMDNVIHDANTEIMALREKIQAEQREKKDIEKKNDELLRAYREKAKSHNQISRLYTALKQQQFAGGMEMAAENDAENVVQAAQHRVPDPHRRAGSNGSGLSGGKFKKPGHNWQSQFPGVRGDSAPLAPTPSTHRYYLSGQTGNRGVGHGVNHRGTPRRAPLQNLNPNAPGAAIDNASYGSGLNAGMKTARHQNTFPMRQNGTGVGTQRYGGLPGR